ncbi:MAG TPA: Na+/H+ antiporter NhaA [Solirubrobacterales bacterium]|nr:Na+/H+ antiporter NhaA [Solirubrobacterales bacterium]
MVQPLERFLQNEAGSASLLLAATVVALVWANLWPESYNDVWETVLSIDLGPLLIHEDLQHWINDLLMAVFFYVVALEVKREMVFGSLRDPRSAAVPAAAALGTIAGGALTYVAVNLIGDGDLRGWAIPVATDIAFAVGALGLVGRRAPKELRAFMLTLAVVDDLATILIIGAFFSDSISVAWIATAAALIVATVIAQRIGIRSLVPYVVLAGLLWLAVFESGVHATIAGVVLGFLTPAVAFHSRRATAEFLGARLSEISSDDRDVSEGALLETSRLAAEAVSPLTRMEQRLHPWTAYAILPLFALANAGVAVSLDGIEDALRSPIGLGVLLGLVIGAPLGGILFAWSVMSLGPGRMPEGLDWPAILGVAPLKGIGFTIAIFISMLAFDEVDLQEQAKLAILIGSAVAAIIGLSVLYVRSAIVGRSPPSRG